MVDQKIYQYNISKFNFWIKQFYLPFILQNENNIIFKSLGFQDSFNKHKISFLNQFLNYKQPELFLIKDIYVKKFIFKRWLQKQFNKNKKKSLFVTKDLYTNSKISKRFCNMFMKKGSYSKILKVFLHLNFYFKNTYGFELIYLLLVLLYLYKVPYSNKLKKKSGRILTIPTHVTIDRFFFKFFNLFTKAILKRNESSIFLRLVNEIEALVLISKQSKLSFFFKDFSDYIDLTLSGRTNLLKKKRKIKKKLKKKKKKKIIQLKKYKKRKKRGLNSRVYRYKIKRFIHAVKKKNLIIKNKTKKKVVLKKQLFNMKKKIKNFK